MTQVAARSCVLGPVGVAEMERAVRSDGWQNEVMQPAWRTWVAACLTSNFLAVGMRAVESVRRLSTTAERKNDEQDIFLFVEADLKLLKRNRKPI